MKSSKAQLLRTTLLAALAVPGMAIPAFAQVTTGPAAAETEERDVVVVTGSRIARQDYVANSPIVTVDQEDILSTGVTTIDTLLNTMPQFVPGINMTSNNPSNGGQSNLQLRGLGSNRTLVLMNGRRVVPSTSGGTVDVNVLPSQLVGNVETITGGASATYGSDAIAGVVNFILRDDFEGMELTTSFGQTDRGDGNTEAVSLAAGGDFADGAGHAMLMMSYNRRDDIYNANRDFSKISGPSAASPLGSTIFDSTNLPTAGAITAAVPGAVNTNTFGFNNDGSMFSYINRNQFISPGGITYDGFAQPGATFNPDFAFNTGPLNLLTLPQTRYNAFAARELRDQPAFRRLRRVPVHQLRVLPGAGGFARGRLDNRLPRSGIEPVHLDRNWPASSQLDPRRSARSCSTSASWRSDHAAARKSMTSSRSRPASGAISASATGRMTSMARSAASTAPRSRQATCLVQPCSSC